MTDPGPTPARGLAVRAEGTGFHARLWPAPPMPWARLALAAVGFGAVGVAAGLSVGAGPAEQVAIATSVPAFGVLLVVVAWLPGLAPIEVEVTDERVYWHGERYPWSRVADARATGGTLELLGPDGARIDGVDHLRPEVATWMARAIAASRPGAPSPSGST